MADLIESSPKSVGTSDSLAKAVVTFEIPELKVDSFLGWLRSGKPRNAEEYITFGNRSINFQLTITTNKKIKYKYAVNKLPGEILPDKCEKKVREVSYFVEKTPACVFPPEHFDLDLFKSRFYNKKVVLNLVKAKEESWEATLASTGLDLEY